MLQVMLNVQHQQQEHQRRNDDFNDRTFARLEQNDRTRVTRESMLAGQTEVQRNLLHLALTPMDVIREVPEFEFSHLIFANEMKTLVESKNLVNVLNQIRQLTKNYACSPNKPLWFQFLRTHGCLPPNGMDIGGLSCFLMIPGYSSKTAKEVALQHDIAMTMSGDSDDNFHQLLGEDNIVGPKNEHEALVMLQGITDVLVLLGDGPCIASSGYTLAAELFVQYKRHIHRLARNPLEPQFLLWLLNRID